MTTENEKFEKWLMAISQNSNYGFHRINEYRTEMCKVAFNAGYKASKAESDKEIAELADQNEKLIAAVNDALNTYQIPITAKLAEALLEVKE